MKSYETEYAEVNYSSDANAVVVYWKKPVTEDAYKNAFRAVLEILKINGATVFISDITNQGIVGTASRQWMQETIIPEAVKNGLNKVATIMPEDVFKKFYVDMVKNKTSQVKGGVQFQYFTTMDEALAWCLVTANVVSTD